MVVTPIETSRVVLSQQTIFDVLNESLEKLSEKSILAITSKVISLCEGRAIPMDGVDKEMLVKQEADYYLSSGSSKYGFQFTITGNTLIPSSGIDESNGDGHYILWPANPQKTANDIRRYLRKRFNLKGVGVIITDSTCMPLRWGTIGIALAHSGFRPLNSYVGKPDLFGRAFKVSRAGVASGLAAAAVVAMGEGDEQTPIAALEDLPFVIFQDHNPSTKDINELIVDRKDDLFEPFLESVKWQRGRRSDKSGTP